MALALNKLVIAMYAGDRSCERIRSKLKMVTMGEAEPKIWDGRRVDGSRGRIVSRISKGRVRRGK